MNENIGDRSSIMYHASNVGEIPVYNDPSMEKEKLYVLYKSKELDNPGYVYVNTEKWNEALSKCKGVTMDAKEVDEILRKKSNRRKEDIKAFICNLDGMDTERLIKVLEKWFNEFPN